MRGSRILRAFVSASLAVGAVALLCLLIPGSPSTDRAAAMAARSVSHPDNPAQLLDRGPVPGKADKCGTLPIIETLTTWETLSPQKKTLLGWVFFRPTDPGGGYDGQQHLLPSLHQTTHFVVHYTKGTDGGSPADAPDLTDGNSNGVPDYIENYASYFEASYTKEITERAFNPPPDDTGQPPNDGRNRNPNGKYDVFVYNLGTGLAATSASTRATVGRRRTMTRKATPRAP